MSAGALFVAKARRKPSGDIPADDKAPRKSPTSGERIPLFSVKGRPEWYGWLRGLAKHDRSSVVETLDRAAVRYAKEIGYTIEPPER